jgi:hypothetical protein
LDSSERLVEEGTKKGHAPRGGGEGREKQHYRRPKVWVVDKTFSFSSLLSSSSSLLLVV